MTPREESTTVRTDVHGPGPASRPKVVLYNPLCLGITVLTGAPIRDALDASRMAKRLHPALPVVWGGWHPSMFGRECLAERAIDVAVQGQGEETFADLVDRFAVEMWIDRALTPAPRLS